VGLQELPDRPRLLRVWGRQGLEGLRGLSERWGHLELQGGHGKPGQHDTAVRTGLRGCRWLSWLRGLSVALEV
jgi:hypothetical protein